LYGVERGGMQKKPKKISKAKLENELINYLIKNDKKTVRDFCKEKSYNYYTTLRNVNIQKVYEKVNEIQNKKAESFQKEYTKKLEEQGKEEANYVFNLRKYNDFGIKIIAKKIQEKATTLHFKNDAELLRLFDNFIKTRLDIERLIYELMKDGTIEQEESNEKFKELYQRLDELINFKNSNNNVDTPNVKTETN